HCDGRTRHSRVGGIRHGAGHAAKSLLRVDRAGHQYEDEPRKDRGDASRHGSHSSLGVQARRVVNGALPQACVIGEKRAVGTSDERWVKGDEGPVTCGQWIYKSPRATDIWTEFR